jgi:hypothetical protein
MGFSIWVNFYYFLILSPVPVGFFLSLHLHLPLLILFLLLFTLILFFCISFLPSFFLSFPPILLPSITPLFSFSYSTFPLSNFLSFIHFRLFNSLQGKPKEFRKALAGRPHSLQKKDLTALLRGERRGDECGTDTHTDSRAVPQLPFPPNFLPLCLSAFPYITPSLSSSLPLTVLTLFLLIIFLFLGHEIIPAGILDPEILHRVKCWVEDANGRRDFSHVLNVELRKWEVKKKAELKSIAEEQSKNGK